ncbi:unnamed protein product [Anisakis simplex]|uniref:Secreted protein n=1 Tax=Anisakis simplex TaxID=6269 RepID=A0A0M3KC84_ANISI|nr:unnamed protein product [Anisakis simplex]
MLGTAKVLVLAISMAARTVVDGQFEMFDVGWIRPSVCWCGNVSGVEDFARVSSSLRRCNSCSISMDARRLSASSAVDS